MFEHWRFALVEHADKATQRNGSNGKFGAVTVTERPQWLAKANGKTQHTHATAARHPEMTVFVNHHQQADGQNKIQQCQHAFPDSGNVVSACSNQRPAHSRAHWSASSTGASSVTGSTVCCCITAAMSSGISVKPICSRRKAATATSLAAFSTAGMVPPAAKASRANCRQGKLTSSAGSKSSRAMLNKSSACTPASMRWGQAMP